MIGVGGRSCGSALGRADYPRDDGWILPHLRPNRLHHPWGGDCCCVWYWRIVRIAQLRCWEVLKEELRGLQPEVGLGCPLPHVVGESSVQPEVAWVLPAGAVLEWSSDWEIGSQSFAALAEAY